MKANYYSKLIVTALLLLTTSRLMACDYSYLTLNNVQSLGGNEYLITLTYCAGSGQSPGRYGADQNSAAFGFFLTGATYSLTSPYPASLTSPNTGAVYTVEPNYTTSSLVVYDNPSQWWTCIQGGCGPAQATCITLNLRTIGLPSMVEVGGAEAAGVIVPPYGCNGLADMKVYPRCFGFSVNAGADRTVYPGYTPMTCTTLTATTTGTGPFTYAWSTGATTASINVCPATTTTYTLTVTNSLGCALSDQVVVNALNVACTGGKVKMCKNGVNKCQKSNQVPSLLNSGWALGGCAAKTDVWAEDIEALTVYPNPASDKLNLSIYTETEGYASLKIFNLMGTLVITLLDENLEAETTRDFEVDLTNYASGVYIVQYAGPEGNRKVQKVVVTD